MPEWLSCAVLLTTAYPLFQAWRATRRSTLRQAVLWAALAWGLWLLTHLGLALEDQDLAPLGRYSALALTACSGVAVLGARRPGVKAWNFVVSGLLFVLLLPVLNLRDARLRMETPQVIFLAGTLLLGVTNYLPTRLALAALLVGIGVGLELAVQLEPEGRARLEWVAGLCLAAGPWLAWLLLRRDPQGSEADRVWLRFRDSFGVVWGQRVREQMNRAAVNAGWPVSLGWYGLESTGPVDEKAVLTTLTALLRRFEEEESVGSAATQGG